MSRRAKEIIDMVISTAGGWAEAPGEARVVELEEKIDSLLDGLCNQVADDPTQWNPELLRKFTEQRGHRDSNS